MQQPAHLSKPLLCQSISFFKNLQCCFIIQSPDILAWILRPSTNWPHMAFKPDFLFFFAKNLQWAHRSLFAKPDYYFPAFAPAALLPRPPFPQPSPTEITCILQTHFRSTLLHGAFISDCYPWRWYLVTELFSHRKHSFFLPNFVDFLIHALLSHLDCKFHWELEPLFV